MTLNASNPLNTTAALFTFATHDPAEAADMIAFMAARRAGTVTPVAAPAPVMSPGKDFSGTYEEKGDIFRVDLPHGTELHHTYRGIPMKAEIDDGLIFVPAVGKHFSTMSGAAKAAVNNGDSVNGWHFWKVELPNGKLTAVRNVGVKQ